MARLTQPTAEQALDQQIAEARRQMEGMAQATRNSGGFGNSEAQRQSVINQYNSLLAQRQRSQQAANPNSPANQNATAQAEAKAAKDRLLGLGQGGIDRLTNDPTDQAFRQYLQGQMGAQTLDPNGKPFENGAPQYAAQGYDAKEATAQQGQAFGYNPQSMEAQRVNYKDPFDAQTVGAMVNEQAAGAGAAESARNQLMRDAVLANGGNAFDPSLRAAQAESMGQRQTAIANARNQINMVANRENAATQNAAASQNAQFGQQAGQFNAAAGNQAGQYNASANQNASFNNAQMGNQMGQFNANAQNQAGQFGASAQNQAGMFNTGNQMNAMNANFQAGNQARMYNQGQQSAAAGQLGQYNNQRQGMISDAEGRLMNVVGQQVFRGPETQMNMGGGVQLPSFQQYSAPRQPAPQQQGYAQQGPVGTYQNPSIQAGSRSSVWAGSGRPSVGATQATSFGPTAVGNPWGRGAQVGTPYPAVNSGQPPKVAHSPQQPQSIWAGGTQNRQMPGVKQPILNPNDVRN